MTSQCLPKAVRVRRRPEFERAYDTGTRVPSRFMTVFFVGNDGRMARLGVAVGRRFGHAVLRNRAKRLSREVFRRNQAPAGFDVVIVPRREMLNACFSHLQTDFAAAVTRLTQSRGTGASAGAARGGLGRPRRPRRV